MTNVEGKTLSRLEEIGFYKSWDVNKFLNNIYLYLSNKFISFPVWCLTCNYRMVNCQNKARTTTQFSSGTLNVYSLTSKTKRECLDEFFADCNLDVLCLQETKTKNGKQYNKKTALYTYSFSAHTTTVLRNRLHHHSTKNHQLHQKL